MRPVGDERPALAVVSDGHSPKVYDHEPLPKEGTIYSLKGPNAGRPGSMFRT
jgi:hypothetical protein